MDIYIEDNVASEDQTRMRQMILKRSFWLLPMKIWMFSTVKWNPFWNQVDRPPEESFLYIEDNELNRKLLAELLEDSYEVMTAVNGEEGLKLLGENYRDISAVLLDVSMPICDGFQFLDRIRDDMMLSSVPVIVITGSNRPEDEVRCLELGAVDFIRKPYNVRIVKGKINSVIKLRESAIVLSALEYDELTGLYIRQAFFHHAKTLMRVKKDQKFHVVVADVKNFKWINSTYGEKTGDQFVAIVYGDLNFGKDKVEAAICKIAERAPISNLSVNYGIYENVDKTLPLTLICDRMMENGIPFSVVPIELTETAALYNVQIKELTEKMVNVGFELHMDDFGSGYSSMTSLNQLPFDTLKLDKSLIDYIENPRGKEVIRHTIALAHSLGMQVLAEGVETASQVKILRELDCDEIQRFYYSRPVPLGEFCTDCMGE